MMGAPRDDADQRAFQLALTLVRTFEAMKSATSVGMVVCSQLGLALQDGDLGLEVGWLDVGDEAPLKAAAQTIFKVVEFLGGTGRLR